MQDLYTDEEPYNKNRLTKVLTRYIGIDSEDGSMITKPGLEKLNDKQKTVCYLLYVRAAHDLSEISESEIRRKPIQIADTVGIQEVEADRAAYQLSLVEGESKSGGPYHIPESRIDTAVSYLDGTARVTEEDDSFF